ncbi:F-box/kelch-repeat protein like [Capsicum chacoense]
MLWNPSTRKVRRFRRSDAYNDNPNNELFKTVYGLGYDELTDDYEVVEIISPRSTCTISIYSVRRKCWKRLSDSPKSVDEYCYLVNEALHWQAHNRESNDLPSSILSINLSTEAYLELSFPQHEDQLMWMMKEYGMKESWYEFASIPHILVSGDECLQQCVPPICLFENGEILLIHECEMMTYNPREGKFKRYFDDEEWRKRNNIAPHKWFCGNLHNLIARPECYVQSLIDLPRES